MFERQGHANELPSKNDSFYFLITNHCEGRQQDCSKARQMYLLNDEESSFLLTNVGVVCILSRKYIIILRRRRNHYSIFQDKEI